MKNVPIRPVTAHLAPTHPVAGKLGPTAGATNRNIGSVQEPSASIAGAELTTEISTFFAKPSADGKPVILYNGDRQYAQVILTLETAGPVAVSTKQNITPTLSGKGALLETDTPLSFFLAKGNRLYVATTSTNRVKVVIQPVPWLEQVAGILGAIAKK